jgi:site-specific DNA recombinase
MKRAALYARVSTDKQEREETIESQLDALYHAVEAGAYELPSGCVFVDEHASGARLDRPALDRLRDLAAEGVFEAVLVWSPDRLARRYAYQVVLLEELTRWGCEVVFVHHPFGASPEEQMLLQIQGVFAEYERALMQDRTRRGQLFAARQGRVNWGNPPYGYTGLDHRIGQFASMRLQKNERLTPSRGLKHRDDLTILSPEAKQARAEKGGHRGTHNPR